MPTATQAEAGDLTTRGALGFWAIPSRTPCHRFASSCVAVSSWASLRWQARQLTRETEQERLKVSPDWMNVAARSISSVPTSARQVAGLRFFRQTARVPLRSRAWKVWVRALVFMVRADIGGSSVAVALA